MLTQQRGHFASSRILFAFVYKISQQPQAQGVFWLFETGGDPTGLRLSLY